MNDKIQLKKKQRIPILLLVLTLLPLISAIELENGTIIKNICLGDSYEIIENSTLSSLTVNSTCAGDINNITAFYSPTLLAINNTNDSSGIISIFNLTQAIIFNLNGSLIQEEFSGDINITVEVSNTIIIENNFNVTMPDSGGVDGGSGLNQDGGSGNTKINNTLVDSVLIKIFNMDNAFIYFSNGTVLTFQDGDLNVTITGSEYFYIIEFSGLYALNENNETTTHDLSGNSNHGTISGAVWDNDGVLNTLTVTTDYTIASMTGLFTIVNNEYSWSQLFVNWGYIIGEDCPTGVNPSIIAEDFGSFITGLLGFLGIIGIILGIIWLIGYINKLFRRGGLNDLGQVA